jgi:hypothetical protein
MDLVTYDDYDWPPPTGEMIHLKRKQFFWANRWNLPSMVFGFTVGAFFILLIVGLFPAEANAEPHAIVSFDDYELYADTVSFDILTDLIAKTASVIGVCDTVRTPFKGTQFHYDDSYSSTKPCSTTHYEGHNLTITCRELVCVTLVQQRELNHWGQIIRPYRAIIFYRRVTQ